MYQLQLTDGESYNCIRTTPVFTVEMPSTPFTGYSAPCSNSSSHPGTEEATGHRKVTSFPESLKCPPPSSHQEKVRETRMVFGEV
ncbi:unnamed protein product [Caretta caretta]